MADHMNIHHPNGRRDRLRAAIEVAELKARLSVLETTLLNMEDDLEAIFTRIAKGERVELHYPDGEIIRIRADG